MTFVRTLLGDVAPETLGACSAHEHVIIDSAFIAAKYPDFHLADVDRVAVDLREFGEAGGSWLVDTMPTGAGRCVEKLAAVSKLTDIAIVCPTGMHLEQYYRADHPMRSMDREALAELFVREITEGMSDDGQFTNHRAGVIKVAGSLHRLSDHERERFIAAAEAQRRTGCPIITHTEQGTAGMEQIELLLAHGGRADHIVLSHTDRVADAGYHRQLLAAGVCLEYDDHFRAITKGKPCASLDLIVALAGDHPEQLMLGMDLARRSYWHGYGGGPGLAWLVTKLPEHLRQRGLEDGQIDAMLRTNPARAFSFVQS